jgi:glycosyltransferase involved in cell wall biosynthesis
MHVLIVSDKQPNEFSGGVENFIFNLRKKLKINNKVSCLCNFKGISKNKIARKILFDYYNPITKIYAEDVLEKLNPQVTHINSFYGISTNTIKAISKLCPTIITAHDVWLAQYSPSVPNFINQLHKKILFSNLKDILIISPSYFLSKKIKSIGYKRVRIISNGIRIPNESTNYNKNILFVGRLSLEKGLQTIINTLNKVENYQVLILGDGPLKKELEDKYPNIKFLGFQDPRKYYLNASILVMPSICEESFGLSTAEAMSYGLCVIGSNRGATPELIKGNETGLLFKPKDEKDFEKKLDYLLKNPSEIKRMGKNARKFVKKNFDWNKIVKQYEQVYKETIKEFKDKHPNP